jgi:hypothetical protein
MTHSPVTAQAVSLDCPAGTSHVLRDPLRAVIALTVTASVVLHAYMVIEGVHSIFWSVVMTGMTLGCLSCLVRLLRPSRSLAAARMTMTMTRIMAHTAALTHVLMIMLVGTSGDHAHEVAAHTPADSGTAHGAMLLIVILELAVGALAVIWTRTHPSGSTPASGAASRTKAPLS